MYAYCDCPHEQEDVDETQQEKEYLDDVTTELELADEDETIPWVTLSIYTRNITEG